MASRGRTVPPPRSPARAKWASPEPPAPGLSWTGPVSTDTSEHTRVAASPPPVPRRRRSKLTVLGGVVSIVLVAAVVYWASKQQAPQLPHTPGEIAALIGA